MSFPCPGQFSQNLFIFRGFNCAVSTTLPSPEGVHRAECAGDDTGGHDILSGCLSFHPLLHTENERRFCNTTKCNELPQPPDNQVGILGIYLIFLEDQQLGEIRVCVLYLLRAKKRNGIFFISFSAGGKPK